MDNKNIQKLKLWMPLAIAISMVIGMFIGYKLSQELPTDDLIEKKSKTKTLSTILKLLDEYYVDTLNIDKIIDNASANLLSDLDPFTKYISADYFKETQDDLAGHFEGIGIEYTLLKDTPIVVKILENSPASQTNLKEGDKIIYVDSVDVLALKNKFDIRKYIKGPSGTNVMLKIKRHQQKELVNIAIVRGSVNMPSVNSYYMLSQNVGYIKLNTFSANSHKEFVRALDSLKRVGMEKLIFDLRDNGGGFLDIAISIVDEFLDQNKLIVYTQGKTQKKKEVFTTKRGLFETGELVVLINENSASASEVVSGALQDWDRATIVGKTSFGKGLVQQQFTLPNNAGLRLTVAKYFTPSGRCIQKKYHQDSTKKHIDTFKTSKGRLVFAAGGITPDIIMPIDSATKRLIIDTLFLNSLKQGALHTYCLTYLFTQYPNIKNIGINKNQANDIINELRQSVIKHFKWNRNFNKLTEEFFINYLSREVYNVFFTENKMIQLLNEKDSVMQKAYRILNK